MKRTKELVSREDMSAKRKPSSVFFYFLSHAVEAQEQPEGPHRGLLLSPGVTSFLPPCPEGSSSFPMKSPARLCCLTFALAEFKLGHHSEMPATICY